ncbi:D,D-heptose 1,7-bisphosphate phosphatase [Paucimonas lemoignei]|uniref:D,D-heptose 1,7-bisphosphate phosphatase n=1 Tax=Paucimonas lemoignei TaxID=29443 RepID=A0A4R3HVD4_PAULE|nr:HAD family hydrolase [Paucimonas lemoignei]TCS34680.1 D,D-heptose 1,7-bisphosphate phosphatase [Paucimonas lemoignei]
MRAVFIDKDGTLVDDVPYNVDPARVCLSSGAVACLRLLRRQGFRLFVVTNQPGVARGYFDESELMPLFDHLHRVLDCQDVAPDGYYYCPHSPDGVVPKYAIECECRKPLPGMLLHAAETHGIDLSASWMIGDILNDVECGRRAGCKTVLIDNGNETEWLWSDMRRPHLVAPDLHAAATMICQCEQARSSMKVHSDAEI